MVTPCVKMENGVMAPSHCESKESCLFALVKLPPIASASVHFMVASYELYFTGGAISG